MTRRSHSAATTFFAEHADDYASQIVTDIAFTERVDVFARMMNKATLRRDDPEPLCIDLGCGPGTFSIMAREMGFRVVGVDANERMLQMVQESAAARGFEIALRQATLPLASEDVDCMRGDAELVILSSVIEYVADDAMLLKQCRELLAPHGRLLVSFANSRSILRRFERMRRTVLPNRNSYMNVQCHQHSLGIAHRRLREAGLVVEQSCFYGVPSRVADVWRTSLRPAWLASLFMVVATPANIAASGTKRI